MGGLGLRQASNHWSAAYISSVGFSSSVISEARSGKESQIDLAPALFHLNSQAQEEFSRDQALESKQRVLSHSIDLHIHSALLGTSHSPRELARLHAVSQEGAGDWLNASPTIALGLHLSPLEFTLATRYRLGVPVYPQPGVCPVPTCTKTMDNYGDHALACASSSERISRHNRLRDSIFTLASQAGLGPRKEEPDLLSGNEMRPGDVFLPCFFKGRGAALDITVVTPIQDKLTERAAGTPGAAAEQAHTKKLNTYYERCRQEGIEFLPMAVETWGGWHPKARDIIKTLSTQMARQTGGDEQVIIRHTRERLGILLQRGNVSLLTSRIPEFSQPEVDGELDIDVE